MNYLKLNRLTAMFAVAALLFALTGCESTGSKTKKGAAIGAVAGALAGAAIGSAAGDTNEVLAGAAIGAAAGGALGGGIGYYLDKQAEEYDTIEGVDVETNEGTNEAPPSLTLSIDNELLFAKNSSSLSPMGTQKILEIAEVMREYPDTLVYIKGYASSEGADDYNLELSQRRADMVAKTLIGARVASHRITAMGMGESNPVASNATEEGRMQNRRVEIEVFPMDDVR